MTELNKRLFLSVAMFLSIAALAGMWILAKSFLEQQEEGVDVIQAVVCDFQHEPCKATRGNQQVIFAIDAETVASFIPLDFRVQLVGLEADSITINFEGVDMFMGINTLELIRHPDGSYTGTRTLPGHIDQSMVWRAKVFIRRGETVIAAWFDFEAR